MTRRYLLDTGIAQDFQCERRGIRARALEERRRGHRVGIGVPILGELWSGVEGSSDRAHNLALLRRARALWTVWPITDDAAEEFGRLFHELRRIGRPMQQIDIQIAAIARTLPNCVVVSKDGDFAATPGLAVENWAE